MGFIAHDINKRNISSRKKKDLSKLHVCDFSPICSSWQVKTFRTNEKVERFHLYSPIHYNITINSPLLECLLNFVFHSYCTILQTRYFFFFGASIAKTLYIIYRAICWFFFGFLILFLWSLQLLQFAIRLKILLIRFYPTVGVLWLKAIHYELFRSLLFSFVTVFARFALIFFFSSFCLARFVVHFLIRYCVSYIIYSSLQCALFLSQSMGISRKN